MTSICAGTRGLTNNVRFGIHHSKNPPEMIFGSFAQNLPENSRRRLPCAGTRETPDEARFGMRDSKTPPAKIFGSFGQNLPKNSRRWRPYVQVSRGWPTKRDSECATPKTSLQRFLVRLVKICRKTLGDDVHMFRYPKAYRRCEIRIARLQKISANIFGSFGQHFPENSRRWRPYVQVPGGWPTIRDLECATPKTLGGEWISGEASEMAFISNPELQVGTGSICADSKCLWHEFLQVVQFNHSRASFFEDFGSFSASFPYISIQR